MKTTMKKIKKSDSGDGFFGFPFTYRHREMGERH